MEKQFKSTDERTVGYGPGYVIDSNSPDFLVGRLLTIIETLGLSEKQEKATKDLIRSEVYGQLNLATWINGNLRNVIKDFTNWYEEQNFPCSASNESMTPDDMRSGVYTITYNNK